MVQQDPGYRLAVDIGGTFTDVVLETPDGFVSTKVLTRYDAPEEGVATGVAQLLDEAGVAPGRIGIAIHGTTLATNALIERRGARTALITTEGFRDVLEFAFGHRFDQYDLRMRRPEPLIPRPLRHELPERISAEGEVLLPLDEAAARALAARLREDNIASVAVCFLHSYRNPAHERRVGEILAEECPGIYVSLSHEICPEIREYERCSTTAANAYVQPLMAGYLNRLQARLAALGIGAPLLMIMSAGSLTSVETAIRLPVRLVESGPAGGAILAQHVARETGAAGAIAFDMGGTTAKIIMLNDFHPRHSRSMEVARAYRFLPGSGLPLRIPVIDLIEIGAGGGSIGRIDDLGRIAMGPESAGSEPGPACYGRGGVRPTVTDANLMLGKLDPERFAGGSIRLDRAAADAAVAQVIGGPSGLGSETAAAGMIEVVDEQMANATRVHAADNGDRVEGRTLIATGGAAPLHAARIAQKLGIARVVIPEGAGVGSARGFLRAPVAYEAVRSQILDLGRFDAAAVNAIFADLRAEAEAVLRLAGRSEGLVERRMSEMRYAGQGHDLTVALPVRDYAAGDGAALAALFAEEYRRSYRRTIPNLKVQAQTWTLVLSAPERAEAAPAPVPGAAAPARPEGRRPVFDAGLGRFVEAAILSRATLAPGARFDGPAVVVEAQTSTFVPAGFSGHVGVARHLILEAGEPA